MDYGAQPVVVHQVDDTLKRTVRRDVFLAGANRQLCVLRQSRIVIQIECKTCMQLSLVAFRGRKRAEKVHCPVTPHEPATTDCRAHRKFSVLPPCARARPFIATIHPQRHGFDSDRGVDLDRGSSDSDAFFL